MTRGGSGPAEGGRPTRVVAIGASAGGLEPIRTVLQELPARSGMAFIVIQHLDPDHKSLLVSLLGKATVLPTVRIEEGMPLKADHVYVIPEKADVTVKGGTLHLQPRPGPSVVHEPLDILLTSIAREWRQNSVGVILSGSDQDGLAGMKAVREAGGLVMAQDPATAQYESMPRHVVDAGLADAVLSPIEIGERLAGMSTEPKRNKVAVSGPPEKVIDAPEQAVQTRFLQDAEQLLAAGDERPAAVVDSALQVQAFRGDVEGFITVPAGPATLDLTRMVPERVAVELRALIAEVSRQGTVAESVVPASASGEPTDIRLEVIPMSDGASLVLFDRGLPGGASEPGPTPHSGAPRDLKREMAALRLTLQRALQEKDGVAEQLQSSVEEAQSFNEELQTAKEELQSTNEELVTVNEELQERNSELIALNDDLTSLLTSVDIPVVVLGKNLDIRRFTPSAQKVLNVIPTDVGRPITDLRLKIEAANLPEALRHVLETGEPHEEQVHDEAGSWYALRLRAYRAGEGAAQGAVISLIDIDKERRVARELQDELDFSSAVFDTVREPLVVLDSQLRIAQANSAFYEFFQVGIPDTEGKRLAELGAGQWDVEALRKLLDKVVNEAATFQDYAVTYRFPSIGSRTIMLNARQVVRPHLGGEFVLLAMEDITDRRAEGGAAN